MFKRDELTRDDVARMIRAAFHEERMRVQKEQSETLERHRANKEARGWMQAPFHEALRREVRLLGA